MANDPDDIYGLGEVIKKVFENYIQNPTLANNEYARKNAQEVRFSANDPLNISLKEFIKFNKEDKSRKAASYGGGRDLTAFEKNFEKQVEKYIAIYEKQTKLTADLVANLESAKTSLAVSLSRDAINSKTGPMPYKLDSNTAKGSVYAQWINSIFDNKVAKKFDLIRDTILYIWNQDKSQEKVKQRHFVEDLVEGLSKSKWVGGVLMDLVKLASYFAANWLKQFGPIGKALAVGVIALAPLIGEKIASILVKAVGSLISGIGNAIGNIFKAGLLGLGTLLKASFTKEALLKASLQGRAGVAAVTGITRGSLAMGSGLALAGAYGLGRVAVDSWNEGGARGKGASLAFGTGALGLGALGVSGLIAAIAPAFGASLMAAVAPIAVPVVAIATGVGLIIKFWPQIMDFFKSVLQFLGIIVKDGEEVGGERVRKPGLVDKVANIVSGKGASSTSAELLKGKTDKGGHLDPNKFTKEEWELADKLSPIYGKKGEIVNLGQMTQRRASEVVENDIKKHEKAGTQSFYERVGRDLADVDQFGTDLRSSDGNYVYMARGFSDWWRATLDKAEQAGYDVGGGRITSGMGSLGKEGNMSPHTYTDSWRSHFSSSGLTFDAPKFINKKTGRYLTEKEYQALGITYAYTEGDHDHLAIPGFVSQDERAKDLTVEEKSSIIESAKKSIAIQKEELKKAEEEADADGKRTIKEKWNIAGKQLTLEDMEGDLGLLTSEAATKKTTSITGMKQLRDSMHSKVFRDLLTEAIASSTGQ